MSHSINLSASVDKLSRSHREWLRDWPCDATATGCSANCNDQVPIPAWTGNGARKDGKSLRAFFDLFSGDEKGFLVARIGRRAPKNTCECWNNVCIVLLD